MTAELGEKPEPQRLCAERAGFRGVNTSMTPTAMTQQAHQLEYDQTLEIVHRCAAREALTVKHAFHTDAAELWPAFLAALPEQDRQHHTCRACRHFVERFGDLVIVDAEGKTRSLFWSDHGVGIYARAIEAMDRIVRRAAIVGPLVTTAATWGQPVTGPWSHFAAHARATVRHLVADEDPIRTPGQRAALVREEFKLLSAALSEYPADLCRKAAALLSTGKLYRSDACVGVATWLVKVHDAREAVGPRQSSRDNITWVYAAEAPAGWCHIRSGMIGTLLDDLKAELPFDEIAARFRAKMDPTQYLRPTAPVSAGNVAQAEKIVDALGLRPSLARRFAKVEDLTTLWVPRRPKAEPPKASGTFGHLLPSPSNLPEDIGAPPVTMTWTKFAREVLPHADEIECFVPMHGNFCALVTAVDPKSPPILQWDREDARNPVSWYVYKGGSMAASWNLNGGWSTVTAICEAPSRWNGTVRQKDSPAIQLVIDGARDTRYSTGGGFFPECLRAELHEVRSTLEAYARSASIQGADEATACGLLLVGESWGARVRVIAGRLRTSYTIDRWD